MKYWQKDHVCNRGFSTLPKLAIMPILASEALLCENKKNQ